MKSLLSFLMAACAVSHSSAQESFAYIDPIAAEHSFVQAAGTASVSRFADDESPMEGPANLHQRSWTDPFLSEGLAAAASDESLIQ